MSKSKRLSASTQAPSRLASSSQLDTKERCVLATLLADWPAVLPPLCARLLCHAPESFEDLRLGTIAAAMHALNVAGTPVAALTIREHLEAATGKLAGAGGDLFLSALPGDAVTLAIAEYEAEGVWRAFTERKARTVFSDAQAALESQPDALPSILDGVRAAIEIISGDGEAKQNGFTIRRPDEILAMAFDDSDRILGDRLLATGQSLTVLGAGGLGKSRLLLQLAAACLTGRDWLGFTTRGQSQPWLILQAENSNRRLRCDLQHIKDWLGKDWPAANENLFVHTLECDCDGFMCLESASIYSRLTDIIEETKPAIIAFDPLNAFAIGDPNKDSDMLTTCQTISRLAKHGNPDRAIVVLHHALTGRAGAARAAGFDRASFGRNSKVLQAWTRGQINVAPGTPDDNDTLILSCGKCSNGKEFAPFAVRLNQASMIYELAPDFDLAAWQSDVSGTRDREPLMTPNRVRELCAGPMTKAELARAIRDDCGCARQVSYRYIGKAEKAGKIRFSKTNDNYTAK
ncbi:MAG: AAA family ATPase [Verrucomicrobiota bacterium]